jgi:ribonuclease J
MIDGLKIIPLGGLGEIGLNMMVFEYSDTIFIIDAGVMFPENYMLGVDYVIPDFTYLKENKSKVAGIVLTHAHEDHIGALPYLLKEIDIPIFGTRFTLGIVEKKLEEHGLLAGADLHIISHKEGIRFGVFELEFIRVSHSVVDGVGVAVKTPVGLVVHTGDFKISHNTKNGFTTDISKFARLGEQGVLALLSDSTNAEKDGYTISEGEVGRTLSNIAAKSKGRIIVATFASSIPRIQQIVDIAERSGRKVIFNGRSIETSVDIARSLGYLLIPEDMVIDVSQVDDFPDSGIIIITTGSQGEPMAALARMSTGHHKQIKIQKEDTVILSSKFIPNNEKAITRIINNLCRLGANVIYEKISAIHVSGHAFREELKLMINLTKPRYFIPIHGEYRHLVLHARLAEQIGVLKENIFVAEDGEVIVFDKDKAKIEGQVTNGRVFVDGKGIGDVGRNVLKERRILSEDGLVVVNMALDQETGIVIYGPEIVSRGFVFENKTGHLLEDAVCVILEIVEEESPEVFDRVNKIRKRVQSALRKYFFFTIGRRPVILPFVLEV